MKNQRRIKRIKIKARPNKLKPEQIVHAVVEALYKWMRERS